MESRKENEDKADIKIVGNPTKKRIEKFRNIQQQQKTDTNCKKKIWKG